MPITSKVKLAIKIAKATIQPHGSYQFRKATKMLVMYKSGVPQLTTTDKQLLEDQLHCHDADHKNELSMKWASCHLWVRSIYGTHLPDGYHISSVNLADTAKHNNVHVNVYGTFEIKDTLQNGKPYREISAQGQLICSVHYEHPPDQALP